MIYAPTARQAAALAAARSIPESDPLTRVISVAGGNVEASRSTV